MRGEFTGEDVHRYQSQGFLAVPGLLSPGELAAWRAAVEAATGRLARAGSPPEVAAGPDADRARRRREEQARINHEFRNLCLVDGQLRALLAGSSLGDLVAQLTGFAEVRLYFDRALCKPAFGDATPYHLDGPHWSFDTPGVTAWLALDDVSADNGCLYYYPGSHRVDRCAVRNVGRGIGAFPAACPDLAGAHPAACPLPAGGAVFHHSMVVHGAGTNMTPATRRALTLTFMPSGAIYNGRPSALPDAEITALRPGDPMVDDRHHPVLARRATPSARRSN
jgi:phytanoyl-CoA hydroxylase